MTDRTTNWELVEHAGLSAFAHQTDRLPVPGGWIYRHIMRHRPGKDSYDTMSITFVPDLPERD